jgi:hypothetical protein
MLNYEKIQSLLRREMDMLSSTDIYSVGVQKGLLLAQKIIADEAQKEVDAILNKTEANNE